MTSIVPPPSTSPAGDHPSQVRQWCKQWLRSRALAELLAEFGMQNPDTASIGEIRDFSESHWDFRSRGQERSKERNELRSDIGEALSKLVTTNSTALGLSTAFSPAHSQYDHVLILGGLIRASLLRPALASELIENSQIDSRTVAGIGGFRRLRGDEIELQELAGLPALTNEIDAMDAGIRNAFPFIEGASVDGTEHPTEENLAWAVKTYTQQKFDSLMLVAAPSSDPEVRRANTADTYQFWAEKLVELKPTDRVLLVSSAIYVPYQGLEAIRMLSLRYGCGIDVVGTALDATVDGVPAQSFSAAHFLQEINSTIQSIDRVLSEIDSSLGTKLR